MLKFNKVQTLKYSQNSISGTGLLAFRDIEMFSKRNNADLSYVLDVGCGSGRSTNYLGSFCERINGCDIDIDALCNARKNSIKKDSLYFMASGKDNEHQNSKYKSIFSILMFFHISSKEEMGFELMKCHNSLDEKGSLIIINGTNNLYSKNYLTVKGIGDPPKNDGDIARINLLNLNCEITDYYWSASFVIEMAKLAGFNHIETHCPLANNKQSINYLDEIYYPPYYYIFLRKK